MERVEKSKSELIDELLNLSIEDQHKRIVELSKDYIWARKLLQ